MQFRQNATPEITVAEAPTRDDLAVLAREGFRSVIDLRAPEEQPNAPDRLPVADEQAAAQAHGLHYENVPVRLNQVDERLVGRVGERIRSAPKPVLVHCGAGKRAGAMTLMNLAVEHGMTAEQCLDMARQMGFDCDSEPAMKQMVVQYVERHSPAYKR